MFSGLQAKIMHVPRSSCSPLCKLLQQFDKSRFLCFRMAPLYIVNVLDEVLDAGVRRIIVHDLERKFGVDARRVD